MLYICDVCYIFVGCVCVCLPSWNLLFPSPFPFPILCPHRPDASCHSRILFYFLLSPLSAISIQDSVPCTSNIISNILFIPADGIDTPRIYFFIVSSSIFVRVFVVIVCLSVWIVSREAEMKGHEVTQWVKEGRWAREVVLINGYGDVIDT